MAEDPYIVTNISELQAIEKDLSAHYKLGGDIDASETENWNEGKGFTPIGYHTANFNDPFDGDPFEGQFDGAGYEITNLTIDRADESFIGLFGNASADTRIGNVSLINASVTGAAHLGALVGETHGEVYNASVDGVVVSDHKNSGDGGEGPTSSSGARAGGLVGMLGDTGTIIDSNAKVSVTGQTGDERRLGGLVGWSAGTIVNSTATGDVEGDNGIGGFVGSNAGGTIQDSTATGDATGNEGSGGHNDGGNVGAFAGTNGGTIERSYATGTASGDGNNIGGFVGSNSETIRDSFANGTVAAGGTHRGGLVGTNTGTTETSYAVVDGPSGGLVGNNDGGMVTGGYWDAEATGVSSSEAGTGLDTSQMQNLNATVEMNDFDFEDAWRPGDGDYPDLAFDSDFDNPSDAFTGLVDSDAGVYQIANVYELQAIRDRIGEGDDYALANDINASGTSDWFGTDGFEPIGKHTGNKEYSYTGDPFTGTLDGSGYTIRNLTISRADESAVGLFGRLDSDAMVENVSILDAKLTGYAHIGVLAGEAFGGIEGVETSGTITPIHGGCCGTAPNTDGGTRVGGVVGWQADGLISEVHSSVDISGGSHKRIGGLVGRTTGGSIADSSANGTVDGDSMIGGLVGILDSGATITNSTTSGVVNAEEHLDGANGNTGGLVGINHGTITDSHTTATVDVTDVHRIGGLVGSNNGLIERSSAAGTVDSGTGNEVGGLVGRHGGGSIERSSASGNVTSTGNLVGGLIARNDGEVTQSFAIGSVQGDAEVGGLIGRNRIGGEVSDSYATGYVSGNTELGGLVGANSGTITDSYWDTETTAVESSAGLPEASGLTTAQMTGFNASQNMDGFDFGVTWNLTAEYPRLDWEGVPAYTVDSLEATTENLTTGETGTFEIAAFHDDTSVGPGAVIEVADNNSLSDLPIGASNITNADGVTTFSFEADSSGEYELTFAWEDDPTVNATATVIVESPPSPPAKAAASLSSLDIDGQGDRATIATGNTTNIAVSVENVGDQEGSFALTLSIENDNSSYTDTETVTLDGGNQVSVVFEDASSTLPVGSYDVRITTDDDDINGELTIDERIGVYLTDLHINNQTPPVALLAGENSSVQANLTNTGSALETFAIGLLIEEESSKNTTIDHHTTITLDANETSLVSFTNVTGGLSSGNYTVNLSAKNETVSGTLRIDQPVTGELSNLDIGGQGSNATVTSDEEIRITVDVTNVGDRTGTVFPIVSLEANETIVHEQQTNEISLEPGEIANVTIELLTDEIESGSYQVNVSTADDWLQGSIDIIEPAHIAITSLANPGAIEVGTQRDISATITNVGGQETTTSISLSLENEQGMMVGSDDASDIFLGPDDSHTLTLSDITGDLSVGTYSVVVQTPDEQQRESLLIEPEEEVGFSDHGISDPSEGVFEEPIDPTIHPRFAVYDTDDTSLIDVAEGSTAIQLVGENFTAGEHLHSTLSTNITRGLPAHISVLNATVLQGGNFTIDVSHSPEPITDVPPFEGDGEFAMQYIGFDVRLEGEPIAESPFANETIQLEVAFDHLPENATEDDVRLLYHENPWIDREAIFLRATDTHLVFEADAGALPDLAIVTQDPTVDEPTGMFGILSDWVPALPGDPGPTEAAAGGITLSLGWVLRPFMRDIIGSFIIYSERSFRAGDEIEWGESQVTIFDLPGFNEGRDGIGGNQGLVKEIGYRSTWVRTYDDQDLSVPNAYLTNVVLANATGAGALRLQIKVLIDLRADIAQAKEVIRSAASEHESVLTDPALEVYFMEFEETRVRLRLNVWITRSDVRDRFRIKDEISAKVNMALAEEGAAFDYPTRHMQDPEEIIEL